ncbi:ATP-binding protein [Brevibacillus choshinensis]|uniref:ATP-binding protein n=1 Tax=Brevibacillus choshinensis TaxID=54911 RepID=UPI002E248490|nr:ATP-binding protein [Brevibacillus choshinensis]MED4752891.1 ATP-binding protein [Brevibacillus choshinensis]MED4781533.1 ATP-binding protein [Brevibacillus choshinensis]
MLIIKDILLQLLFIIVPVLLYKNVWLDQKKSKQLGIKSWLVILLSSLSVIFCMSFPIYTDSGMRFDLRSIPLIITILYGGYIPGIFTSVVMIGYRIYLGGDGIPVALIAFSVYSILPFFLVKRWYGLSFRKKLALIILMGFIKESVAVMTTAILLFTRNLSLEAIYDRLVPIVNISYLYILTIGATVYLVEFIRESYMIRVQIERSEKLNLISELAASVAHEVRNPLTVVRGFVQLLREETNPKNYEYIKLVLTELDRAEWIISDYLNLAKPQGDVMSRIELTHIVSETTALMSSYAVMNGVEIVTRAEPGLHVIGNPVKLKQALMNLMKNGIEAMTEGGSLHVIVELANSSVVIVIRDEGEGISPEQIRQIGLPFYSTKEKGTGLGLMVTCRIIEAMQGTILFESELGKGTQAIIQLPAVH